jgi:hypothetical protein
VFQDGVLRRNYGKIDGQHCDVAVYWRKLGYGVPFLNLTKYI